MSWRSKFLAIILFTIPVTLAAADREPGRAFGEKWSVEKKLVTRYVGDYGYTPMEMYAGQDDNFFQVRDHLKLETAGDEFKGGVRLELGFNPAAPTYSNSVRALYVGDPNGSYADYDNDFRVERIFLEFVRDDLHLRVGDFPFTLGKGILLHLDKFDYWGIDNAVRGANVRYYLPGKFSIEAAGGVTNASNNDFLTGGLLEDDPLDSLVAVRFSWTVRNALDMGVHGLLLKPRYENADEIDSPDRLNVDQGPGVSVSGAGAYVDLRVGGISFYLEGNGQVHDNYRGLGIPPVLNEPGYAFYTRLAWDSGPRFSKVQLELEAEGIFYGYWLVEGPYRGSRNAAFPAPAIRYNNMPTLEHTWVTMQPPGNSKGGRFGAKSKFRKTDTEVSIAASAILYNGGLGTTGRWNINKGIVAVHPVLSIKQPLAKNAIKIGLNAGVRVEQRQGTDDIFANFGVLGHWGLDALFEFSDNHAIGLASEFFRHELGTTERVDPFSVFTNTLKYNYAHVLEAGVQVDYSDELEDEFDNRLEIGGQPVPWSDDLFARAFITWNTPLDGFSIKGSGGSSRGGYMCNDGYCRLFPDAVGFGLELKYAY